jgi:hypothetical protein
MKKGGALYGRARAWMALIRFIMKQREFSHVRLSILFYLIITVGTIAALGDANI